ncbi:MAG: hypothetical protein KJ063_14030 [Anaerolineae bacterium]|nr:hypothetical protein [Anaerolineae bacterium]
MIPEVDGTWTQVTFPCAVCGDAAATLALTCHLSPRPTLIISRFMGKTIEYLQPTYCQPLQTALNQQDSGAIYRLNSLWLPSYCPQCQTHYCQSHWTLIPTFDDDFPGWYDCTYGYCPDQHKRIVDD